MSKIITLFDIHIKVDGVYTGTRLVGTREVSARELMEINTMRVLQRRMIESSDAAWRVPVFEPTTLTKEQL